MKTRMKIVQHTLRLQNTDSCQFKGKVSAAEIIARMGQRETSRTSN